MKNLLLLGATGSVGRSTLDVVRAHPDRFRICGVVAGHDGAALAGVVNEFRPSFAAVADPAGAESLRREVDPSVRVLSGTEGIGECVRECGADLCLSAIVGGAGLDPTLAAIECGMDVALANKETLVAAGEIVTERARAKGVRLLPVDSEHSALAQCLAGHPADSVRRLILTASGGPFRGKTREELARVTAKDALEHPTWSMGRKITVDSATLANKALEVIEARWLFDVSYDTIDVLVHPQSLVHALVEFVDGGFLAQVSMPDMRLPVQWALTWPERLPGPVSRLDPRKLSGAVFEEPDHKAFPMLPLGVAAGRAGGVKPAVFSAANEQAVRLFLDGRISFTDVARLVEQALLEAPELRRPDLAQIREAEARARDAVMRRS